VFAVFAFCANGDITKGKIRLAVHETTGTFSVYVLNPNGSQHLIFSPSAQSSTTFFSLRVGNRVYRLLNEGGVKSEYQEIDNGARIIYTVKNTAIVAVDFLFIETIPGLPADALHIALTVTNISDAARPFAVKGLFDTVIDEVEGPLFATAVNPAIKTETELTVLESHQWILVSNPYCSLRMLLSGYGITVPASASIANRAVLSSGEWDTPKRAGRSFSSAASYNDAAIEVKWYPAVLKPGDAQTISMYLSVSAELTPPASGVFITPQSASTATAAAVYSALNISPEQTAAAGLDPVYIEDLLMRIQMLEVNGGADDLEQVRALNAELDAILIRIRR
jgi:hypothetical protein